MKTIFFLLFGCLLLVHRQTPEPDRAEAKAAFHLLNAIRKDPAAFSREFPFPIAKIAARRALVWNDTLAAVAERRVLDMVKRNYFGHVDPDGYGVNYHIHKAGYRLQPEWLKDPKANFFESCNAGARSGEEAIRMLLIDKGVPSLAHRKHLLGMDDWSASQVDVGIGYVRTGKSYPDFESYTCVILAKHQ